VKAQLLPTPALNTSWFLFLLSLVEDITILDFILAQDRSLEEAITEEV
jgi:hypothetical protein